MDRGEVGYAKDFIERLSPESRRRLWYWARKLASRYGLDVYEADDLVQEALWRLLDRNPRLDSEEGLQAYLMTTIRSIAFDLMRRQRMEFRHGRTEVPPEAIENIPAPSRDYEPEDLQKLLNHLSEREREITLLTLEGLSPREIADRLSIEASTVRSFLRRVRARFALQK